MREYNALAMHDYLETGKRYPPVYKTGAASQGEIDRWEAFVRRYPWFPGTDDAYYRLAYAAVETGDPVGALRSLQAYTTFDAPDQDAEPFMLELVAALADQDEASLSMPEDLAVDLATVRAFVQLPWVLAFGDATDMDNCSATLAAFGATPWLAALASTDREIDGRSGSPHGSRLCDSYFRALATEDPQEISEALEDKRSEIKTHLALPPGDDAYSFSEEAMGRLTALNHAVVQQARRGASFGMQPEPRITGWVLFLTSLNRKYEDNCKDNGGAYCRSAAAMGAVERQLSGQ